MTEGKKQCSPRPARGGMEGTGVGGASSPESTYTEVTESSLVIDDSTSPSSSLSSSPFTSPENSRSATPDQTNSEEEITDDAKSLTLDTMHAAAVDQSISKTKGGRFLINPAQLAALNQLHSQVSHPSRQQLDQLSKETQLSVKSVKQWFQNKRSKCRKMPRDEKPCIQTVSNNLIGKACHRLATKDSATVTVKQEKTEKASEKRPQLEAAQEEGTSYQPMTQVSLPPDHPFCQLFGQQINKAKCGTRACRRQNIRASIENATSTPIARPVAARQQGKGERRRQRQRLMTSQPQTITSQQQTMASQQQTMASQQQTASPIVIRPKPQTPDPQTTSAIWRPMALPTSTSETAPKRSESPLDLSVTLKRKREEAHKPEVEPMIKRSPLEPVGGAMIHPLAYPGAGYYGQIGQTLIPTVIPHIPYPMAPLALYGQSHHHLWASGLPRFACAPGSAM